jgi:hypothetical protein
MMFRIPTIEKNNGHRWNFEGCDIPKHCQCIKFSEIQ